MEINPEVLNGIFAIVGAIVGAVVTGLISRSHARAAKSRRELSVLSTRSSPLIAIDARVYSDVEIKISGQSVPTVYLIDITFANSGTEVLQDVEVPVQFHGEGRILAINLIDASFELNDHYTIGEVEDNGAVFKAKYLNAGDQVVARAMFSGKPEDWTVGFRQPGVSLLQRNSREGMIPDVLASAFFGAVRQNWFLNLYMKTFVPSYRRFVEDDEKT